MQHARSTGEIWSSSEFSYNYNLITFVILDSSIRYGLKDDVRQSLYDCCEEWIEAIGEHRQFMGGEYPNLADLVSWYVIYRSMYML